MSALQNCIEEIIHKLVCLVYLNILNVHECKLSIGTVISELL